MPRSRNPRKPLVEVRDSHVHGLGAFALRGIAPGTFIGTYEGRRYSPEEVQRRDWDHELTYVFGLSDGSLIDGGEGGNAMRHLNHSCAPNCVAFEEETDDGELRVIIEALHRVKAGDELFLDYRLDVGGEDPARYPCRCGAPACRGTLVDLEPRG